MDGVIKVRNEGKNEEIQKAKQISDRKKEGREEKE